MHTSGGDAGTKETNDGNHQLNPSEISELIKTRIEKVKLAAEARNEGTVTSRVRRHRAHLRPGRRDAGRNDRTARAETATTFALALNLERDSVGAVVLGDYEHLREGDVAKTTGRILEVPIGPEMLGRVVNALGEPIDGKGPIDCQADRAGGAHRPGRDLAQVGRPAGADRLQVDRLR